MDDAELMSIGGMVNSSDAMFDRRRRILIETRRMIGEHGIDSINIRELCRRAGVAQRTLYNAFGSKENVLALAIRHYFDAFQNQVEGRQDLATLEGAVERQSIMTLRNTQIPRYIGAIAAIYFSPTVSRDVRDVLVEIGARPWRQLLQSLDDDCSLLVPLEDVLLDISNLQYAIVHDWTAGYVKTDVLVQKTVQSVLSVLAGTTAGGASADVRDFLVQASRNEMRYTQIIEKARRWVEQAPLNHE